MKNIVLPIELSIYQSDIMYGGLMIIFPSFFRINHFPYALISSFSFLCPFFYSRLFFTSFFPIILWSNSNGPRRTRLLCLPFWQSNFIKLFNGGLQYEVFQTFFFINYEKHCMYVLPIELSIYFLWIYNLLLFIYSRLLLTAYLLGAFKIIEN